MILIAHRGLFDGPNKEKENSPEQIELALSKGYDAEIDVWFQKDGWWLGHDGPQYKVDADFIGKQGLWIHCKNLDALYELSSTPIRFNYFWHQEDDFTLTSKNYIWTYPGKSYTPKSVIVMPEWKTELENFDSLRVYNCHGICSDYVGKLK